MPDERRAGQLYAGVFARARDADLLAWSCAVTFRSRLDRCTRSRIAGWAWDSDEESVSLIVSINGVVVSRCLANRLRGDLVKAAIGTGRHSFDLDLMPRLTFHQRHTVSIRREDDGRHIGGSPHIIEPAERFDEDVRSTFEALLSSVDTDEEFEKRLAFLIEQTNVLRQRHAERRSGAADRQSRHRLGWHEPDVLVAGPLAREMSKPAALILDEVMPDAERDAGSNAVLSHMQSLQRLGYDVVFAPLSLRGDPTNLQVDGITCCLRPWYETIEDVLQRQRGAFDLVYLHRVSCASRYGQLARHYQPRARLIYSVADLHSLRLARQAEIEGRPDLDAFSKRMQIMELGAIWHADVVITHSSTEADVLSRQVRRDKIHVVPWSVPLRPTRVPFVDRHGIAFIGGYGHQPNVDAARWLVEAIMPHVAAYDPTITCYLVGSGMPDSVRRLRRDNVEPIGHVESLSEIFDKVRLTVAPLAYGAGIKGKVLASLAAGVPCACTPIAAEGLALPQLLRDQVASEPSALAALIARLHADEASNRESAEAGLAYVATELTDDAIDSKLRLAVAT